MSWWSLFQRVNVYCESDWVVVAAMNAMADAAVAAALQRLYICVELL